MQPTLERALPFPVSVLLTSITWSAWQLPLWFVEGSSQQSIPFVAFAAFGLILSFALAALRKKTGCVFYSCIFHGFSNTVMMYFVVGVNGITALGGVAIIIAALLTWYSERRKQGLLST
jgi:membrane protease YdiL (CAAX protease family)